MNLLILDPILMEYNSNRIVQDGSMLTSKTLHLFILIKQYYNKSQKKHETLTQYQHIIFLEMGDPFTYHQPTQWDSNLPFYCISHMRQMMLPMPCIMHRHVPQGMQLLILRMKETPVPVTV